MTRKEEKGGHDERCSGIALTVSQYEVPVVVVSRCWVFGHPCRVNLGTSPPIASSKAPP